MSAKKKEMTVEQLIERLSMLDQDLPVRVFNTRNENDVPVLALVSKGGEITCVTITAAGDE